MIKINISKKFNIEKEYIISVFFADFLGLDYKICYHEKPVYEISLSNKNKIIIKDDFFEKVKGKSYLLKEYLPEKEILVKNKFIPEKDIPVIFGDNCFEINGNKIICGVDIFASSFFMLTRWEEYVKKERDIHGRFSAFNSYAYQNNLLDRPVVNEYLEMLWNMMKYLGVTDIRKKRKFTIIPTHDVDHPLFSNRSIIKSMAADIIKRRSIFKAFTSFKNILQGKINHTNDIFNTFDYLMSISEKHNVKSNFFFMASKSGYLLESKFIKELMRKINKRGHVIGFHPDRTTFNNKKKWYKEFLYLKKNSNQEVSFGRHHFLMFAVPVTWQIWDDYRMKGESSLIYPEAPGFRCGVCFEFPVFNFLTRKKLKLKEYPLIMMEAGLNYGGDKKDTKDMMEKISSLKNKVKKYRGNYVVLWHNSNFKLNGWEDAKEIYESIFK